MTASSGDGSGINIYSDRAEVFFRQYESIRFEDARGHWR